MVTWPAGPRPRGVIATSLPRPAGEGVEDRGGPVVAAEVVGAEGDQGGGEVQDRARGHPEGGVRGRAPGADEDLRDHQVRDVEEEGHHHVERAAEGVGVAGSAKS